MSAKGDKGKREACVRATSQAHTAAGLTVDSAYTLSSSVNAVNSTQGHISERNRLVASQKKDVKATYGSAIFLHGCTH